MERTIASSLCRFRITDEHLVTDIMVKAQIARAFEESRCYEFFPDKEIIARVKAGDPVELFRERFMDMRNSVFEGISKGDQTVKNRLYSDVRLSSRLWRYLWS